MLMPHQPASQQKQHDSGRVLNCTPLNRYPAALAMALVTVLTQWAAGTNSLAESVDRPNIIVIMADDLGYGDVSCYGGEIATPNIDRLAQEGTQFTSGYCSASTCTPTRYSFLTGTHAFRKQGTGIAAPNSPALIPAGTTTIASLMQEAGYATAVIGKWHLGLGEKGVGPDWNGKLSPGPLEIGFDHCYMLPTTNDRVPQVYLSDHRVENLDPADPLWVGNKKPTEQHRTGQSHRDELTMDWSHGHNGTIHNGIGRIGFYTGGMSARFRDEDLADRWVEKSNEWMKAHQSMPFFLFFASHDLHVPRMPHERFQGSTDQGPRGDAIAELDWCVGELIKTVDALGLTEKTMFVFCSDNGPVLDDGYKDDAAEKLGEHKPSGPYHGGKYSVWEGGTRTPFITRMPGTIPVGVSDKMVCTIDMANSFATLVGQAIPQDACLDSLDVKDALLGDPNAKGRTSLVQQDNGSSGRYGFRKGKWKVVLYPQKKSYKSKADHSRTPKKEWTLYNLDQDPNETTDVSADHPDILEKMKQDFQEIMDAGRTR
ncbi:sulfatase family protein [Neorhodopirellula lusitana]|uniref:sulfatase family protein n=1 Tax=Neorhodopirellula lusitana TaxID=445327 RepID=UPI00384CFCD2